jgi:hypothetical protein
MPARIWPPNHRLVPVSIAGVTDADDDPVEISVTRVTQDEPVDGAKVDDVEGYDPTVVSGGGSPAGEIPSARYDEEEKAGRGIRDGEDGENRCPDAVIDPTGAVAVRAERSGKGNGRLYTLWFTASDGRGGSCDGAVQVCVPHDRRQLACVDDGQKFNSIGPCPARRDHDRRHITIDSATLTIGSRAGSMANLEYFLPTTSVVTIALFDIAGRRLMTLENTLQSAGAHEVTWSTSSLAHGAYFYRLQAGSVTVTKLLILK